MTTVQGHGLEPRPQSHGQIPKREKNERNLRRELEKERQFGRSSARAEEVLRRVGLAEERSEK